MSRVAYFKNVNPTVGLDATQNQMLNTLSGQIATKASQADLTSGLAQKADSSAVTYQIDAVNTSLASKVSTADFNSIVNLKASQADLTSGLALKADSTTVDSALALKADTSVVDSALATKADKTTVGLSLASKLDTSVHNARVVNEAVFFDSVANSITLLDANGVELNYVSLGLVPA